MNEAPSHWISLYPLLVSRPLRVMGVSFFVEPLSQVPWESFLKDRNPLLVGFKGKPKRRPHTSFFGGGCPPKKWTHPSASVLRPSPHETFVPYVSQQRVAFTGDFTSELWLTVAQGELAMAG